MYVKTILDCGVYSVTLCSLHRPPPPPRSSYLLSSSERRQGSPRIQGHVPSLRDVAHDGVLCTFSNSSATDRGKRRGPSRQAAWTVHHVQNHTLLGHSPPCSQGAAVLGQPSRLWPQWSPPPPPPQRTQAGISQCYSDNFC